MKKRIHVCFLVFTMSIFYLLISNVVFGQSPAEQVFHKHRETILNKDIQPLLPDVLRAFGKPKVQSFLDPSAIGVILGNPGFLTSVDPQIDYRFVGLLTVNNELRVLFADEQFYNVLDNPIQINELVDLIPEDGDDDDSCDILPLKATTLAIISVPEQTGKPNTSLRGSFVVEVRDQDGKALRGINITFDSTKGGKVSPPMETNNSGRAQTSVRLGPNPGTYQIIASVAARDSLNGVQLTQTFTATAVAPPPKDPQPVVPALSSTAEPPPMYWIGDNRIHYRLPGGREETFPESGNLTGGLAVDTIGGKVYWTEKMGVEQGRIQSANLDGTGVGLVKPIQAVPFDIAFDAKDKMLYWTNSRGRIQRIKVGDSRVENVVEPLVNPQHIAFDVETRRLYWTDARGIWSTFPESAGRQNRLFLRKLDEVRDIAVFDDVVYWTEQTRVRYRNGTGLGDKKFLPTPEGSIPEGIAVDPVGKRVYWTTSDGEIRSAPLTNPTQFVVERSVGPATGIALGGTTASQTPMMAPSISPAISVEDTLLANYPNPFNPETWIPYQLSTSADVSVSIYSVNGHLVRRLELGHQSAGVYRSRSRAAYWDGRNEFGERVASGLYFYTLTAGDFTATRKMLIRK